jgi:hypothetical protein
MPQPSCCLGAPLSRLTAGSFKGAPDSFKTEAPPRGGTTLALVSALSHDVGSTDCRLWSSSGSSSRSVGQRPLQSQEKGGGELGTRDGSGSDDDTSLPPLQYPARAYDASRPSSREDVKEIADCTVQSLLSALRSQRWQQQQIPSILSDEGVNARNKPVVCDMVGGRGETV